MSNDRADLALVARGFYESRAKAQEAIAAGLVRVGGRLLRKASEHIPANAEVEAQALYPWVSRGGVKCAAALDAFGFDPTGRTCLDVGASTGGFTHVLISRGAARVYAVDVGRGQLHHSLRRDVRVISMEGTDARLLQPETFFEPPSLVVCDASFISLTLVLPPVLALSAPHAALAALIKPQFEVGRANVAKGVVRDQAAREQACARICDMLTELGWSIVGLRQSPIEGGDGNIEYLVGARRR